MYSPVAREARTSANALDVHPQIFSYSNDSEQDPNETDQKAGLNPHNWRSHVNRPPMHTWSTPHGVKKKGQDSYLCTVAHRTPYTCWDGVTRTGRSHHGMTAIVRWAGPGAGQIRAAVARDADTHSRAIHDPILMILGHGSGWVGLRGSRSTMYEYRQSVS